MWISLMYDKAVLKHDESKTVVEKISRPAEILVALVSK